MHLPPVQALLLTLRVAREVWRAKLASTGDPSARQLIQTERGDVPGWVLITIMTAGIVTVLWQFAGPALQNMLEVALNSVTGP